MLDKFYYENNKGEILSFGDDGIFANYNDLRDYEWKYDSDDEIITNFHRGVTTKSLPAIFCGKSGQECRIRRNNAYVIAEQDVILEQKGKLHIGDYYMNCWIYGITNSDYLNSERFLKSEFKVVTDEPVWRKEKTFEFIPSEVKSDYGFDFPFDFPFDFQNTPLQVNSLNNESIFDVNFKMTFYGAVENPQIQINGHTYRMNCNLEQGERIVIDSLAKTINKYGVDNSEQNFFNYRYKPESIFEKIPCGVQMLSWGGEFGFDITLIDERSEPKWKYTKLSISDISDVVEIGTKYYLLDSDGNYILDSDGDTITTNTAGKDDV